MSIYKEQALTLSEQYQIQRNEALAEVQRLKAQLAATEQALQEVQRESAELRQQLEARNDDYQELVNGHVDGIGKLGQLRLELEAAGSVPKAALEYLAVVDGFARIESGADYFHKFNSANDRLRAALKQYSAIGNQPLKVFDAARKVADAANRWLLAEDEYLRDHDISPVDGGPVDNAKFELSLTVLDYRALTEPKEVEIDKSAD